MNTITKTIYCNVILLTLLLLAIPAFAQGNTEDTDQENSKNYHNTTRNSCGYGGDNDNFSYDKDPVRNKSKQSRSYQNHNRNSYGKYTHSGNINRLFWNKKTEKALTANDLQEQDTKVLETVGADIQQLVALTTIMSEIQSENEHMRQVSGMRNTRDFHNKVLQNFNIDVPQAVSPKDIQNTLDTTNTTALHTSLVSTAYSISNTIQEYSDTDTVTTALLPYLSLLQQKALHYIKQEIYALALQNEQVSPEITRFVQQDTLLAYDNTMRRNKYSSRYKKRSTNAY